MKKQYVLASISIMLWATSSTVVKLMIKDLTSMQVLAGSNFFAVLCLLILMLCQKKVTMIKSIKAKDYLIFASLGTLGIFIYYAMLNEAINLLQAQEAFVINYLWPIMTMLFAVLILKERFSVKKLFALLVSFAGVFVIATHGRILELRFENVLGVLMAVTAGVSYGLFSVLVKKKSYDVTVLMLFCYLTSLLLSLAFLRFEIPELNINQVVGFLWLGAFTQGIPFVTWALALKYGDTAKVSNSAFITPVVSMIFTTLILGEHPHLSLTIGLVLILMGIFLQSKRISK